MSNQQQMTCTKLRGTSENFLSEENNVASLQWQCYVIQAWIFQVAPDFPGIRYSMVPRIEDPVQLKTNKKYFIRDHNCHQLSSKLTPLTP